ncbi:MAG: 50S ribosomal protein L4 [Chloroflexi bacterium]|nr:50S ribosomal protein L4 [Chloroflexota bacterium]
MQVPVYNLAGEVVKNIEIDESVFGVPANESVVHQAVLRQRANARHGTADTKTRGEVAGSTKKLFRQKGTGEARAGSMKSPLRKGGGTVFGPHPRSYRQSMPKKMRRLALRCALSAKAGDGELLVLDRLQLEKPRTRDMEQILGTLGVGSTALVVTESPEENVIISARNLPGVWTLPASLLNVVDILGHKQLLMTEAAVRKVEQLWGLEPSQRENNASL